MAPAGKAPSVGERLRRAFAEAPPTAMQLRNQSTLLSVPLLTVPFPNSM